MLLAEAPPVKLLPTGMEEQFDPHSPLTSKTDFETQVIDLRRRNQHELEDILFKKIYAVSRR